MSTSLGKILVIDDDEHIRRSLRALLCVKQYDVQLAANGRDGLACANECRPDLVILDLNMPGMHGLDVCKALRTWYKGIIIVLSALEHDADKIAALDLGADDYVTKPCSTGEMLARIRAHLRRVGPPVVATAVTIGELTIDLSRRRVKRGEDDVALTPTEFELLALLARNADCVVTYRTIVEEVWHEKFYGDTRAISVHISNLRKKIEPDPSVPRIIQTEHGAGFRLVTG